MTPFQCPTLSVVPMPMTPNQFDARIRGEIVANAVLVGPEWASGSGHLLPSRSVAIDGWPAFGRGKTQQPGRVTTRWAPPARPSCTVIIGLVFGRGTDIRRPQIAARSSRRLHLGRCQPAAQSSRRRTRNLPAFFARLRTADHRQFMLSKDRCSGSPLRAPACHLRYPRIEDDRQVGARDRVRKRPSACRRKD